MNSWAQTSPDALLDGLHQDAHEGNFQTYFERYTSDAVFLGTDKTERWSIEEFKLMLNQHSLTAMAGLMK